MIFKTSAIIILSFGTAWWNDGRHVGCYPPLVLAQEQDHGTKVLRGGHPNHGSDGIGFSLLPDDPTDAVAEAASAYRYTASAADVASALAPAPARDFSAAAVASTSILAAASASASASVVDSTSALVAGADDEGVGSSNKGAKRGGGMDIDLVDGGYFVPVDLSSSVAVGDENVLEHSTVSSIDDIEDPLSIFPDKSLFVEADSDRLLKNKKAGKVAKNIKGGKKDKSKKKQCTIDLFRGSYRYNSPCGKGILATIVCGEDDDGGLGGDICRYSERVVTQNTCPESGLLNDEEEEDPCSVGGVFKRSENINYNADTNSCELAYFDFTEDRCELYLEEGGLGMKAVIHLSARQEMLLRFSSDSGETFYNEEEPRIAVVSSDVDQYDAGRALSSDLIHAAKQRRLSCEDCNQSNPPPSPSPPPPPPPSPPTEPTQPANTIKMCVQEMVLITKQPSVGATVECFDKDPNNDDLMKKGITGQNGCVTMSYRKQSWDGPLGGESPDIYCTANKISFVQAVPNDKDNHDQSKVADFGIVTLYRDRKPDSGETNGCGPEITGSLNEIASFVLEFGDQCFQHDKCYWDCQIFLAIKEKYNLSDDKAAVKAQAFCDFEMYEGMKSYCYFNNGHLPGFDEEECLSRAIGVYKLLQEVGATFAYDKDSSVCPKKDGKEAPSMENDYRHLDCYKDGAGCGYDGSTGNDLKNCNFCCSGDKFALDEGNSWDDYYCKCLPKTIKCGSTAGINWNNCGRCCNGSRKDAGQFWENDNHYCI